MPVIGYSRKFAAGGPTPVTWLASSLALPSGMALTRASAAWQADYLTPALTSKSTNVPRFVKFSNGNTYLWIDGARTNMSPSPSLSDANWDHATNTLTSGIADPFGGTGAYRVAGSSYFTTSAGTYTTTGQRGIWCRSVTGQGSKVLAVARDSRDGVSTITETWQFFSFPVSGMANFPGYIYCCDFRTGGTATQAEVYWPEAEAAVDFLSWPVDAAATRAAENLASSTLYAPAGGWTWLLYAAAAPGLGSTEGDQVLAQLDDGTANNRCLVRRAATGGHLWVERYAGGSLAGALAASIGGATALTGASGQIDMGALSDNAEFRLAITWPAPPGTPTTKRFGRDTTGHYWFGGLGRFDEMTAQTNTALATLSA